jgi:uncharacterized membrane protein
VIDNKKRKINLFWIGWIGFFILFMFTFVICWIKGANHRLTITILMFKITGFAASLLLVLGELGHKIFDRICIKSEKLDCFAVMHSPAAKFLGRIPMADLGVIYFIGGIILIAFSVANPYFFHQIFLLAILNLLTLPYTIFSVLYQAFVVKKWCYLCLVVQLIFWLEFSQFYKFLFAGVPRFHIEDFFPFVWSFALPALVWILFRPFLKKAIQSQ